MHRNVLLTLITAIFVSNAGAMGVKKNDYSHQSEQHKITGYNLEIMNVDDENNHLVKALDRSLLIEGESKIIFDKNEKFEDFELESRFYLKKFVEPANDDPLFQLVLNQPIKTDKVRLISDETFVRIVELGIYEPGMPEYPDLLGESGRKVDVPNYASDANITASSYYAYFIPERVIDNEVSYTSRWVSTPYPPHELMVDFGQNRVIGFIQMLTGLPSVDGWSQIAKNFKFQYWDGEKWVDIAGSRRESASGQLGIIIGENRDCFYTVMYRKEAPNWLVMRHKSGGEIETIAQADLESDLIEGKEYVIDVVSVDGHLGIYLNKVLQFDTSFEENVKGRIGFMSGAKTNSIELKSFKTEKIFADTYEFAGDIKISADDDNIMSGFVKDYGSYNLQLPSKKIKTIKVEVEKAFDGQRVFINGKEGAEYKKLIEDYIEKFEVRVISADGNNDFVYNISASSIPPRESLDLVYADEFQGESLNTDDWYYRLGMRWESVLKAENVSVGDGKMRIALRYDPNTNTRTIGGIISKKMYGYGYYETSAKLWKGSGWHSAFWQLGYKPPEGFGEDYDGPENPGINEIDAFESTSPNGFSTNLHYHRPKKTPQPLMNTAKVADKFHTYGWEWTPRYVRFFFDGKLIREVNYLPPHGLQNVWLSCVAHSDATLDDLPGEVLFDYFRFYSKDYGTSIPDNAIVFDNQDENYFEQGDWQLSEYALSHKYNHSTRESNSFGDTAGWRYTVEKTGQYEIFTWNTYIWPDGPVTEVCYEIELSGEDKKVRFNPMLPGQKWVSLGRFELQNGDPVTISLNVNKLGFNRIDSVMLVPLD